METVTDKKQKCHAGIYEWGAVDCDAPFCGCNPAWQVALDGARECGWLTDTEARALKEQLTAAQAELLEARERAERNERDAERHIGLLTSERADVEGVLRFAKAMTDKLAKKRLEGRSGWNREEELGIDELFVMLAEHVKKGDVIDIANLAMMIWNRNYPRGRNAPLAAQRSES